jgi:hypothetical protein
VSFKFVEIAARIGFINFLSVKILFAVLEKLRARKRQVSDLIVGFLFPRIVTISSATASKDV